MGIILVKSFVNKLSSMEYVIYFFVDSHYFNVSGIHVVYFQITSETLAKKKAY
jgi:hypothetical protein